MNIDQIKSRDDLPQFFAEKGYKVGAEIGVREGVFTEKLCRANLKIYGIDPWGQGIKGFLGGSPSRKKRREHSEAQYQTSQRVLSPYIKTGKCALIRKTSMDAVLDFKNDSLDFVYIDGNHKFKYIAEDLYEWTWKVKKGGIVAGHDYYTSGFVHVKPIVNAYMESYGIKDLHLVAGGLHAPKDMSWFWVKE